MAKFTVRDLVLGCGRPKICVPLSFKSEADLPSLLNGLTYADLVEWRADSLDLWDDRRKVISVLKILRQSIKMPLIFTCRTSTDGGTISPDKRYYVDLICDVADSGQADIIDVEMNSYYKEEILHKAKITGTGTILSYHNFNETPYDIGSTLNEMVKLNADIYKVAYMPKNKKDVLRLMESAIEFNDKNPDKLLISISMGTLGIITRIMAKFIDSPLTFGSSGNKSAPGQFDSDKLLEVLEIVECNN